MRGVDTMFEELSLYLSLAEVSCFDNEGGDGADNDGGGGDGASGQAGSDGQAGSGGDGSAAGQAGDGHGGSQAGDGGKPRTFTQDDVNRIVEERLARDRKSREEQNRRLETQLQELLKTKELSDQERERIQESLDDVQQQLRSKEQQANHEKKQLQNEYERKLSEANQRAESWEVRFRESSIGRALQDAAVANDAFNSSQIVNLLRPMTKLVELVDETTGRTIGEYKTVVDLPDRDEKGQEVMTQGTPDEIVKRMKELGEYANLFKANVVSGVGANSATGGLTPGASGRVDVRNLTPEQYMKLRKEKPELFGFTK